MSALLPNSLQACIRKACTQRTVEGLEGQASGLKGFCNEELWLLQVGGSLDTCV